MSKSTRSKQSDILKPPDRHERVSLLEPLVIARTHPRRAALTDLAFDLAQKSAGFHRSLPPSLVASLADLVRAMNCYYSNLIEGHYTHPIDIERALKSDYSSNAAKRDLQLEAAAHIAVQQWIDCGGLPGPAVSTTAILELHRRFYENLPDALCWVDDPVSGARTQVAPGELRFRDVKVGSHLAISPAAVPRFLGRVEQIYGRLGKSESILSAAAAHHRLLWIHPFLDGNGRVARLMSHATLLQSLDTGALWSIARGLGRNVADYKAHLANCDRTRRNYLDGRGHLSEEALIKFTEFFLKACIDQVSFMQSLFQPERLHARILIWAEEEVRVGAMPGKAGSILEALLYRGELSRSDAASVTGVGERQTRRVVSALMERGVLTSEGPRGKLRLVFPAALANRWLPGLFPEPIG